MQQTRSNKTTFADRLNQALDNHPEAPNANFGRLRWVVEEMAERGQVVTMESVRRWLDSSIPRKENMEALCDVLDVDQQWLTFGESEVSGFSPNMVYGPVNIVAGLMLMSNLKPEFPADGDRLAEIKGVHLRSRVGKKALDFHVIAARDSGEGEITVEMSKSAYGCTILLVKVGPKMTVTIHKVDYDECATRGELVGEKIVATYKTDDPALPVVEEFYTL